LSRDKALENDLFSPFRPVNDFFQINLNIKWLILTYSWITSVVCNETDNSLTILNTVITWIGGFGGGTGVTRNNMACECVTAAHSYNLMDNPTIKSEIFFMSIGSTIKLKLSVWEHYFFYLFIVLVTIFLVNRLRINTFIFFLP